MSRKKVVFTTPEIEEEVSRFDNDPVSLLADERRFNGALQKLDERLCVIQRVDDTKETHFLLHPRVMLHREALSDYMRKNESGVRYRLEETRCRVRRNEEEPDWPDSCMVERDTLAIVRLTLLKARRVSFKSVLLFLVLALVSGYLFFVTYRVFQ
jgi:hypothetical protein